jgi:regulator of protease activity HflC (stomatin/prohibitin superfamily)
VSLFTHAVKPGERLIEQRPGRDTRALEPGRHRRRRGASYLRIDVRERLEPLAPQEVRTADGAAIEITAVIRYAVSDAVAFVEHTAEPLAVIHLAVQVALRDALSSMAVDGALATARRTLSPSLTAAARGAAREIGIDVREVVVKDVVLPSELRAVQLLPADSAHDNGLTLELVDTPDSA